MPDVLILTGNCGVGKTTIARAWAESRNGASIHADDMHLWIRVQETRRDKNYQEDWKASVAITATQGLIDQGLDVAIDNVWLPDMCERLRRSLSAFANVTAVRIVCDRDVNHERDRQRMPGAIMGPRVDTLADELERYDWPSWITSLDTSSLNIDKTLTQIEQLISANARE